MRYQLYLMRSSVNAGIEEEKVNMWEAPTQFAKWKTEHVGHILLVSILNRSEIALDMVSIGCVLDSPCMHF